MTVCESCGAALPVGRTYCSRRCAGRARAKTNVREMHGAANPRYNGGLSTSRGRTIIVCRDGSLVPFSRAVMEAHLGRKLTEREIVHHENEDPTDDRVENLLLTTRPLHMEIHRDEIVAARWPSSAKQAA